MKESKFKLVNEEELKEDDNESRMGDVKTNA